MFCGPFLCGVFRGARNRYSVEQKTLRLMAQQYRRKLSCAYSLVNKTKMQL